MLAFHAPLLDGAVPSGFDVVNEKLFWRSWTFDRLKSGQLPLWNPHVLCGYPMHADPVQAIFYPLEWIHLFLPHALAIGVSFALAGLVACWGTMRLARFLGADPWGSAVAGAAYATSGLVAGHIGLGEIPHLEATSWTPWCVVLTLEALDGRRGSLAALPVVTAFTVLAGHVQYGYQTLVATAITAFTALGWMFPRAAVARRLVAGVAPAVLLGISMTSVALVPALSYVSHSNRGGGLDWTASTTGAIHPLELLRLVAPDFFGDAVITPYWGGFIKEMATPYVGIATLMAVPWALASRLRRGVVAVAPMALFGLVIALSAYSPVHRWAFDMLPGFTFFRMPVRWLHLFTLGLAVGGGLGVTSLGTRASVRGHDLADWLRAAALPSAITALAIVLVTGGGPDGASRFTRFEHALRSRIDSFLGPEPDRSVPGWTKARPDRYATARAATLRALALSLASAAALLALPRRPSVAGPSVFALVSLDLWAAGHRYVSTVPADSLATPPPIRSLLSSEPNGRTLTLLPGSIVSRPTAFEQSYPGFNVFSQSWIHRAMVEDRDDVGGIFFVVASRYRELAGVASSFEHETIQDRSILDLLGVRWVVAPSGEWPSERLTEDDLVTRVEVGGLRVLENLRGRPRVFLARTVEIAPDASEVRARLAAPDFPHEAVVLTPEDIRAAGLAPGTLLALVQVGGHARITNEGDERLSIEVDAPAAALLVIADAYDPGWRATIDGLDAAVVRADLALRAVPVPAGVHQVVLSYRPRPLLYGAALTALGLLAWLVLWLRMGRGPRAGVQ